LTWTQNLPFKIKQLKFKLTKHHLNYEKYLIIDNINLYKRVEIRANILVITEETLKKI